MKSFKRHINEDTSSDCGCGGSCACDKGKQPIGEGVELDELSQETLRSYHAKAALDLRKKREKLSKGTMTSKDHTRGRNLVTGLNRAANKMEAVDEAVDKSSPVYKEYLLLKKKSIADLRKMLNQKGRGAVDLKGYDKQGAISDLLRGQFGSKKVAAAMGVAEGYDPTAKVSPEQKKKNIEAAKKRSKKTLPWQKNYDDRKRKEPGMNESKMSELQGYIDDGKSAAWIAKKIGFPLKDVKDFLKQNKAFSESVINEGKMKDFHDMVSKGMSAAEIAKKIKMPVKDVADFMKGMKEDLDESVINDITAKYINEHNIASQDLENMTEDELNELISEALKNK
mgnify:FL=1